jgi:hypothetical protein
MKVNRLVVLSAVALAILTASSIQKSMASNHNPTPSAPYEAWSTHKSVTMSPERMSRLDASKSDSMVKVRTRTGSEQTMKLGAPIGKL